MYCKKCGKHIEDDSKFCMFCGQEIKVNPNDKEQEKATRVVVVKKVKNDDADVDYENPEKKNHGCLIVAIVVIVSIAIIIGVLFGTGMFDSIDSSSNNNNGGTSNGGNSSGILTRSANNNDIYVTVNNDFSLEISLTVKPYTDINGLSILVEFADKNHNIVTTKTKYLGKANKDADYKVSFALTEFSVSQVFKIMYIRTSVESGTVSYFS